MHKNKEVTYLGHWRFKRLIYSQNKSEKYEQTGNKSHVSLNKDCDSPHLETHIKESRASRPWATDLKCTSFAKLFTNFLWSKAGMCSSTGPLQRPSVALPDEIPGNKKERSLALPVWTTTRPNTRDSVIYLSWSLNKLKGVAQSNQNIAPFVFLSGYCPIGHQAADVYIS